MLLLLLIFPLAILLKGVSSLPVVELPLLPARWQAYEPLLFSLGDFLGTPLLTLVYLPEIGLNLRFSQNPVAIWMGQVGEMSLTNYLLQSGLSTFLFYDNGQDLAGQLTLLKSIGVVGSLHCLQGWFSHCWLSHYQQGPLERLLNQWSNGKAATHAPAPVD